MALIPFHRGREVRAGKEARLEAGRVKASLIEVYENGAYIFQGDSGSS